MSSDDFFPEWPEVWRRVHAGYARHVAVLREVLAEQEELRKRGYGDPLDGFVATALYVAEVENRALWEAQKRRDASALVECLERTLQGLRWYVDVDLSWSAVWERYRPEFHEWIKEVRQFLDFGRRDPRRFIDYTGYGWTT